MKNRPPAMAAALRLCAAALTLALAFAPTTAHAQCPGGVCRAPGVFANSQQGAPHPAVVRIIAPDASSVSYGSGSLIEVGEGYGLVITNWHVVADATGQVKVVFPDGFCSAARVLKLNHHWDLAALLISRPNVEPIPMATEAPRIGDLLTIAGYGSGQYRVAIGRCIQYVSPGRNSPYEMIELSVAARQGDSGGPIFNDRGELAGVLFGAGRGTTTGSYVGRVRWFVADIAPKIARPRDEAIVERPAQQPAEPSIEYGWIARDEAAPDRPRLDPPAVDPTLASEDLAASDDVSLDPPADEAPWTGPAGEIRWTDLAGTSPWEQTKTFLAIVGALAIIMQLAGTGTRK